MSKGPTVDDGSPGETVWLLQEQLEYYRAGAAEYDAANRDLLASRDSDGTSRRTGREQALAALAVAKGRKVLELAGGTGVYTEALVELAGELTVVDGSPESLAINQARLGPRPGLEFVLADLFTWSPAERYEVVVFAFWLSHVPPDHFHGFWDLVDRCLAPEGTVVVIDARAPTPDAARSEKATFFSEDRVDDSTVIRRTGDGTLYRIIRVMWSPDDLTSRLAELGWVAEFEGSHWLIGQVTRASHPTQS